MDARAEWPALASLLAAAVGRRVSFAGVLGRPRPGSVTWAAEAADLGEIVVKVRTGDRADEKTRWCATHLPLLGARGYPVPEILWHGPLDGDRYALVQRRVPGTPLRSLEPRLLERLLALVELQADAGIDPGPRDFAAYAANVLFDDWDHVWGDAARASREAEALCARLRRWLQPVWGTELPAPDFAHNDLNLTNVLVDRGTITGVVDWDEFGLNSRAADLAALAFDCERLVVTGSPGHRVAVEALLGRMAAIADEGAVRCHVGYRALTLVAALHRRGERERVDAAVAAANGLLARLTGSGAT